MNSKRSARSKTGSSTGKTSRSRPVAATKPRSATRAKAAAAKVVVRRQPGKTSLEIPPILLEGDTASAPPVSGPGQRYALGPTPPAEHFVKTEDLGELPEAYGTKRLLLTARDPQWLYAHWDLTAEQQKKYNALSADGHLILCVHVDSLDGHLVAQVHVHPESRHWFVHVGRGGTKYIAELGYNQRNGEWANIATSAATLTPPESMSADTSAQFATIPMDVPFGRLLELVKAVAAENVPLVEAIQQLRAAGYTNLPDASAFVTGQWTPAQERALAEAVSMDKVRRVWIGSLEITELIRRQLMHEMASLAASQFSVPSSLGVSSLSSPFGGEQRPKGFWFNVNAELIIYGATEPNAKVTIGGRVIKLRPDGTFSYRFSLPDGKYPLPAVATSADGDDTRWANLQFSRGTQYGGEVGQHPQDSKLKPPVPESVA